MTRTSAPGSSTSRSPSRRSRAIPHAISLFLLWCLGLVRSDWFELERKRSGECGQKLPESYQASANEPWTTGICGCAEDAESRTGLFCRCVLFGHNVEALREDIPWTTPCTCHVVCVEGGIALASLTAIFPSIDPSTSVRIGEVLYIAGASGAWFDQTQRGLHICGCACFPHL
ncbi:hypothetical protein E2562_006140 [Oryza meyeriana var. granulata]|uniref:Uncharacterized protein n=1 Tax=Oryza meyeriana var. granulata TaxID=110450 RepID=A0A6G1EVN6_9ORYZ|nr:hypothetical protein E2562_006140 [Oryza meyeriana var. granulata]